MASRFSIKKMVRQEAISTVVRKMEKSIVGTFPGIWNEFCAMIGETDPKNFERYVDEEHKRQ